MSFSNQEFASRSIPPVGELLVRDTNPVLEVARTADPVRFAYLQSALSEAGIASTAFDGAAGSLWPGAIPRRLMVDDRDAWRARHVLKDAEAAVDAAGPPSDVIETD